MSSFTYFRSTILNSLYIILALVTLVECKGGGKGSSSKSKSKGSKILLPGKIGGILAGSIVGIFAIILAFILWKSRLSPAARRRRALAATVKDQEAQNDDGSQQYIDEKAGYDAGVSQPIGPPPPAYCGPKRRDSVYRSKYASFPEPELAPPRMPTPELLRIESGPRPGTTHP